MFLSKMHEQAILEISRGENLSTALGPISIQAVRAFINTCQRGEHIRQQDRAPFLFSLATGARAREAGNISIKNVDLNTGAVIIRFGKGGKTRMVFIVHTTRRAMRAYLRLRQDSSPCLFQKMKSV